MSVSSVPSSVALAQFPFVDERGKLSWAALKVIQVWQVQLQNGITPDGNIKGDIEPTVKIVGRGGDIATILSGIDDNGIFIGHISPGAIVNGHAGNLGSILQYLDQNGTVLAGGIDFARAYANKDTDHIADGSGSPLQGGKVSYLALVASAPSSGEVLTFNGTVWQPQALPASNSYLKGNVTINITGTSGTFGNSTIIPGATPGSACFMGLPDHDVFPGVGQIGNSYASTNSSGSPGQVDCNIVVNGLVSAPGNVTFPVIVFP